VRAGEGPDAEAWRAREDVGALIAAGNAGLASRDPAQLDFRQLHLSEVKAIEGLSYAYARSYGIERDQARRELVQQALFMVDATWAEQEHIQENPRARAALEALSASEDPLSVYALGEGWFQSEQIPLFTADPAQYQDRYLFANQLAMTEGQPAPDPANPEALPQVAPALQDYLAQYATAEGHIPLAEQGLGASLGGAGSKAADGALALGEAVLTEPGFIPRVVYGAGEGLVAFGGELIDTGPKALIPSSTYQGLPAHRALVDRFLNDEVAYRDHDADSVLLGAQVVGTVLTAGTGGVALQGGRLAAREGLDQAREVARYARPEAAAPNTGSLSAETANAPHIAVGRQPPYAAATVARDIMLKEDRVFVRVHGEGNQQRSWLMRPHEIDGLTPKQIQERFALPEVPAYLSDVHVPAGTRLRVGTVGEQPGWGTGGATQYELLERLPSAAFQNTRPLK
jgi:hypothetical protein